MPHKKTKKTQTNIGRGAEGSYKTGGTIRGGGGSSLGGPDGGFGEVPQSRVSTHQFSPRAGHPPRGWGGGRDSSSSFLIIHADQEPGPWIRAAPPIGNPAPSSNPIRAYADPINPSTNRWDSTLDVVSALIHFFHHMFHLSMDTKCTTVTFLSRTFGHTEILSSFRT